MKTDEQQLKMMTRRHFFRQTGSGIGTIALAALLNEKLLSASPSSAPANPLAIKPPHFAPKAKSVIYLFMAGAPTQLDLFDSKPVLNKFDGQPIPEEFVKGERFAFIKGVPKLLGSPYRFSKHGQSGNELSELLIHQAKIADDIAIVRSMVTDAFNHAPAQIFLNTGSTQF